MSDAEQMSDLSVKWVPIPDWRLAQLEKLEAAPPPLDGLREALAEAVWATSDAAEEGPWIDATEAQRRMTLEWADAIIERVPTLRDEGETP